MKIKDLLQAHTLPSVEGRKEDGGRARETEFDLITVIARQFRRLRKSEEPTGTSPRQTIKQAQDGSKSA